MKLYKTKKMLQEYINKNRQEQRGRPLTDTDIREVKQELTKYERMYKFYMISTILLFVTLLVVLFNL
jgi:cell division protein FtsL